MSLLRRRSGDDDPPVRVIFSFRVPRRDGYDGPAMTVNTRHFLVDGDEIRPLAQAANERLRRGEIRLPGYAGRDLHVVDVSVEVRDRAPVRVRDIRTAVLSLDERGALRSRLLEELRASLAASRTGRVPGARWSLSLTQRERATELALGRVRSKLKSPRAVATGDGRGPAGRHPGHGGALRSGKRGRRLA